MNVDAKRMARREAIGKRRPLPPLFGLTCPAPLRFAVFVLTSLMITGLPSLVLAQAAINATETDLTVDENGPDTGSISFVLNTQPAADVTFSISNDGECSVSPPSLTFTPNAPFNWNVPQTITISGTDDADIEGTHTCELTVNGAVSADANYNGLTTTLSDVSVADDEAPDAGHDLKPLSRILQQDFEQTIGVHSRLLSSIAGDAAGRVGRAAGARSCGDGTASKTSAGDTGMSGSISHEIGDCQSGTRSIASARFTALDSRDIDSGGVLNVTFQRETMRTGHDLVGMLVGGYVSRSDVDGNASGHIDGYGGQGGLYGVRDLQNGLSLDYYAALGFGYHRFDLSFGDAGGGFDTKGNYGYAALLGGAAISGTVDFDSFSLTPRGGVDFGLAHASDPDVTIRDDIGNSHDELDLDNARGGRGHIETAFGFGGRGAGLTGTIRQPLLEIAPRLFCEQNHAGNSSSCGVGGKVKIRYRQHENAGKFGVLIDFETIDEEERSAFELSYDLPVLGDAGFLSTNLGVNQTGTGNILQKLVIPF